MNDTDIFHFQLTFWRLSRLLSKLGINFVVNRVSAFDYYHRHIVCKGKNA